MLQLVHQYEGIVELLSQLPCHHDLKEKVGISKVFNLSVYLLLLLHKHSTFERHGHIQTQDVILTWKISR